MSETVKNLPENIDVLKALLVSKDQRIAVLEEQLQLLKHKRFGASSEKADADQLNLFNEAEGEGVDCKNNWFRENRSG